MGLCNLKHVKQTNDCSENPGGTSNYCMVVPIDSDHIEGNIEINDEKNQYNITPKGGSGSTLIACEQLNRKCYMMELDPHYADVIIERWEKFTGKKAEKIKEAA